MRENQYFYGNPNENGIEQAICTFAAHESLHSKKTSSLPLVEFWSPIRKKDFKMRMKEIRDCTRLEIPFNDCKLCFEYAVPVGKGRGKSSMTDLMLITPTHAIAIEAKYTECKERYETIGDWLDEGKEQGEGKNVDKNRLEVIGGWLEYIRKSGCTTVPDIRKIGGYNDIPYQLLHRIASACAVNEKIENHDRPAVIYHIFYDSQTHNKATGFAKMLNEKFALLQLKNISFSIVLTEVESPDVNDLPDVYAKGQKPKQKPKKDYNELFLRMLDKKNSVYTFHETTKFSEEFL